MAVPHRPRGSSNDCRTVTTIKQGYVLVGGWPGSGKTTLARALATELDRPHLAKDEITEALMDELGAPSTVEESQRLGRAAVNAVLRVAQGHHSAVIDSTWFARTLPLVNALGGPFVEVRCTTTLDIARRRYKSRARDSRHLDHQRSPDELWGSEVLPLGVGPLLDVDTSRPRDAPWVASGITHLLTSQI